MWLEIVSHSLYGFAEERWRELLPIPIQFLSEKFLAEEEGHGAHGDADDRVDRSVPLVHVLEGIDEERIDEAGVSQRDEEVHPHEADHHEGEGDEDKEQASESHGIPLWLRLMTPRNRLKNSSILYSYLCILSIAMNCLLDWKRGPERPLGKWLQKGLTGIKGVPILHKQSRAIQIVFVSLCFYEQEGEWQRNFNNFDEPLFHDLSNGLWNNKQ